MRVFQVFVIGIISTALLSNIAPNGSLSALETATLRDLPSLTQQLVDAARVTGKKAFGHIQQGELDKLIDMHFSKEDHVAMVEKDGYDWPRVKRLMVEQKVDGMTVDKIKADASARGELLQSSHRKNIEKRLNHMLTEMQKAGVVLSKCTYVDAEISEPYMRSKEMFLYGADIDIIIEHEGVFYKIQLDDCVAMHRGWVLVDGFRWNPKKKD